jgi:transposase
MDAAAQRIDIYVDHEKGIRIRCPECGEFFGMFDHAPERIYRHLNTCQMETYIHVRPPRVNCSVHGVKQVDSEVGENGSDMTYAFEGMVIRVAQECSIEATARLCGLSSRGHKYESLVYDLDAGTVEFVWDDRGQESLESYCRQLTKEELAGVKAVAMDMWDPYIAATKAYVPEDRL